MEYTIKTQTKKLWGRVFLVVSQILLGLLLDTRELPCMLYRVIINLSNIVGSSSALCFRCAAFK
jgi:hypothetical protein